MLNYMMAYFPPMSAHPTHTHMYVFSTPLEDMLVNSSRFVLSILRMALNSNSAWL